MSSNGLGPGRMIPDSEIRMLNINILSGQWVSEEPGKVRTILEEK